VGGDPTSFAWVESDIVGKCVDIGIVVRSGGRVPSGSSFNTLLRCCGISHKLGSYPDARVVTMGTMCTPGYTVRNGGATLARMSPRYARCKSMNQGVRRAGMSGKRSRPGDMFTSAGDHVKLGASLPHGELSRAHSRLRCPGIGWEAAGWGGGSGPCVLRFQVVEGMKQWLNFRPPPLPGACPGDPSAGSKGN